MKQLTLAIVGLGLAAAAAVSCATWPLPDCIAYEYRLAEDESGAQYRLLDEEDVAKLHALITGLAHGTCRLPTASPRRPDTRPVRGMQI